MRRACFLLLLIPLVALVFAGLALGQAAQSDELTLKSIFAEPGLTGPQPTDLHWRPDGKQITYLLSEGKDHQKQMWALNVGGGASQPQVLIDADRLATLLPQPGANITEQERDHRLRYRVPAYHWSHDGKQILFDSFGQLWLYTLATKTAVSMNAAPGMAYDPKFSPDGTRISYIRDHNLYTRPLSGKAERRLTRTQDPNLLNGEVDWVYKEELDVRRHSNYFWSPDSRQIVLLQMNETAVPTYPLVNSIGRHATVQEQKYPQAGDSNPEVRLGVVSSSGGGVKWLTFPEQKTSGGNWFNKLISGSCQGKCEPQGPGPEPGSEADIYIPRFGWVRNGLLYAIVLNRAQDEMKLYFIDAHSGHMQLMLDEKDKDWVPVNDDFQVVAPTTPPGAKTAAQPANEFLWSSWRSGHQHLYLYAFDAANPLSAPARLERQLTSGDWDLMGVDSVAGDRIYFTSTKDDVRQRQLYSVRRDGSGLERVSTEPGTHTAIFGGGDEQSGAAPYYVDRFSALMTPPRLSLCQVGAGCRAFFESRSLAAYHLQRPEFVDFTAADGTLLHAEILLPAGTAEHSIPLINNPYGGPGAQMVLDTWGGNRFLFDELLAREGFAVLHVDNRGMGGRGREFTAVVRRDFGEHELQDQLGALDQALSRYPQLNPQKLGWWGWSYGGYMTLYALSHSRRFAAGVAVAPVTDWHNYDSIYTERYMGLPQQNEAAYEKSSPVSSAGALAGDVLIAHGSGDDNVHPQNTMQMTQKLLDAHKLFELMLYPLKTHAIAGAEDQTDLFTRINAHFEKDLLGAACPPAP